MPTKMRTARSVGSAVSRIQQGSRLACMRPICNYTGQRCKFINISHFSTLSRLNYSRDKRGEGYSSSYTAGAAPTGPLFRRTSQVPVSNQYGAQGPFDGSPGTNEQGYGNGNSGEGGFIGGAGGGGTGGGSGGSSKGAPSDSSGRASSRRSTLMNGLSPRAIKKHLDSYVIGQKEAKMMISVVVYNHYLRAHATEERRRRVRNDLNSRLRRDAVTYDGSAVYQPTDSYYPGQGTTMSSTNMRDLMPAAFMFQSASSSGSSLTAGFGEEADIDDQPELDKTNMMLVGPTGTGKTLLMQSVAKALGVPFAIVDCTALTQAGYVGDDVDVCIQKLLANADYDVEKAEFGVVVLDECDKIARPASTSAQTSKDISGECVQQSLLQMLEGADITVKRNANGSTNKESYTVNTKNILFVLSGAFVGLPKIIRERLDQAAPTFGFRSADTPRLSASEAALDDDTILSKVETRDLIKFGLIPELIGRIPLVSSLMPLNETDMIRIITEPKNSVLKQYEHSFHLFGVSLKFTVPALQALARLALSQRTGARGLKSVMAKLLLDVNYDLPESAVKYVLITEDVVNTFMLPDASQRVQPFYYTSHEQYKFVNHLSRENDRAVKQVNEDVDATSDATVLDPSKLVAAQG
ncbi:P-loop containing nucleoside triphosphate hydrolase protein [Lipomyces oligophaga]|uniref:P-loop containing nucleoside triphosphate hydrolase protein n=1 Tax=Lipomyces oligophaga TaxID=45792 RepID=UPI0034CD464C